MENPQAQVVREKWNISKQARSETEHKITKGNFDGGLMESGFRTQVKVGNLL